MGHVATIHGLYDGVKTGTSAKGNGWVMLQFKVPESYKGVEISPEQLSSANLSVFPQEGQDYSSLTQGQRCSLKVDVSARKDSTYPQYSLLSLKVS